MSDVQWDRSYPIFAPELFANIIEHQDQDALTNSSLVCSSWLSFARPRLFSHLRFDERRVKMFIDDPNIIDSPLSTIRPLVRVVAIYNRLPLDQPEIVQLFSLLKTVTGLSYGDSSDLYSRDRCLDEKTAHDLVEIFPNINALTLFTGFRNLEGFINFICGFPFLCSVSSKAMIWSKIPTTYSHLKCRPSPTLRVLNFDCRLSEILPWLIQLDPIPQITELTLKGFLGEALSSIGQLLSALGPSLKRLTLVEELGSVYPSLPFHEIKSMTLGLQSNSELEYLQFSCPEPDATQALTALIVQVIISRATSLSLREVSISLVSILFDPVIWEKTDEIVASLPSPRLEKFTVRTSRTETYTSSIQQSFPLCHRLGILQVVCEPN